MPPIQPDAVTGLIVWLQADGLAFADGARVTLWESDDPAGNDFVETIIDVGWDAPTFQTNELNALGVVRFSDGFEGMTGPPALSVARPYTILYVAKYNDTDSQTRRVISSLDGNWLLGPYNLKWQWHPGSFAADGPAVASGQWVIHAARARIGNGQHFLWDLDSEDAPFSSAVHVSPAALLRPALGRGGSNEPAESDVAEIIMYDNEISDADRDGVVAYLRFKWANVGTPPDPPGGDGNRIGDTGAIRRPPSR